MGNLCSCLKREKTRYIVSVLGLKEDVEIVLANLIPNYNSNKSLPTTSEHLVSFNNIELIVRAHIINSFVKDLIKLHFSSESAAIYSINMDNDESINAAKSILKDYERAQGDVVSVLCRGKIENSPAIEELYTLFKDNIHDTVDFLKFNENEIKKKVEMTFNKICNRLAEN